MDSMDSKDSCSSMGRSVEEAKCNLDTMGRLDSLALQSKAKYQDMGIPRKDSLQAPEEAFRSLLEDKDHTHHRRSSDRKLADHLCQQDPLEEACWYCRLSLPVVECCLLVALYC